MKKILLVEDDQDLGASTAELLQLRHEVEWVTSADEAFKRLSRGRFDAAILDLALGLDSSVTLVNALRRFGHALPPLIIFSAQPIAMIREAVAASGAIVVLQKPCSGQVIEEAIDFVIAKNGGGDAPPPLASNGN